MSDQVDFAPLGEMEITSAGDLFEQCEFIRVRASNAGLLIAQWANDVEWALRSVPVVDGSGYHGMGQDNPTKRARRVARHGMRAADLMRGVALSAAKLPPAYLKTYQDIIQVKKGRKAFDPKAGL